MEEELRNKLIDELYSKFNFSVSDKEKFEDIIFHNAQRFETYEDIYQNALNNIDSYLIKQIKKEKKLVELMKASSKVMDIDETYIYFDKLTTNKKYKIKKDEITYLADEESFKEYYEEKIKGHKEEVDNDNYRFLENDLLAKIIEVYSLTLVDVSTTDQTPFTNDVVNDYRKTINKIPILTKEEELELAIRASKGDKEAKDALVEHNLKYVFKIAKKYLRMKHDLSLADLIEEGNIGLIKSVDKFDYTKGFRFTTYATWWIRQAINNAISNKGRTIRIPAYKKDEIKKVNDAENMFLQKNYRDPSIEELSEITGLSLEKVQQIKSIDQPMIYLDKKVNTDEGEDSDLYNFLPSSLDSENDVIDEKARLEKIHIIRKCLNVLDERERTILIYRFGLFNKPKLTLEQIGKILGVSRERVRQLEPKVLDKFEKFVVNYKSIDNEFYGYKEETSSVKENIIISEDQLKNVDELLNNTYDSKNIKKAERIVKRITEKNPNLKIVGFNQNVSKITLYCNVCLNTWTSYIDELPTTCYCPNCKQLGKHNKYQSIISELNSDIVISNLVDTKSDVDVHCNRCGSTWRTRLNSLIQCGALCKQCRKDNRAFVKEIETIALNSNKVKNFIPDYSCDEYMRIFKESEKYKFNEIPHDEISVDDVSMIVDVFKLPLFERLSNYFLSTEIMILLIDNGYIKGSRYTDNAICKLLSISKEELNEKREKLKCVTIPFFKSPVPEKKKSYQRKRRR